jgi:nucleoside-diphosphate-sugar epimerase
VTGSSGFIASHLISTLLDKKANVIGIDIKSPKKYQYSKKSFKYIRGNICEKLPTIKDIDVIFHLAATASPNYCQEHPDEAFKVNVQGVFNMLEYAKQHKIPKFIFTSSAQLYGTNPKYLPIDETHPIVPTQNVYTVTKKLGEDLCNVYSSKKLSVTILRLFNVFGPEQDFDYFIPTIIKQSIEKKYVELWSEKPTRDWNYVQNTVDALLAAGLSKKSDLFNVGSGIEIKTGKVARFIASKFNAKVKFQNIKVSGSLRLQCNSNKIKRILKWEPKISFDEGLLKTTDWYESFFQNN